MFQGSRSYCFERVFCTSDPSWECGGFKKILPKFSKLPAPEIESQRPNGCEECSTGHAAHPCRAPSQVKYDRQKTIRMANHRPFAVQCIHIALGPTEQYNIVTPPHWNRNHLAIHTRIHIRAFEPAQHNVQNHHTTTTTPEPVSLAPQGNFPRPSGNHQPEPPGAIYNLGTSPEPAPGRCIQAITDHIS